MKNVNLSTNLASHFFDLVIGKILTSRLSLSKHLAHNLGNLLLLGKIGVFHNRRNASSRLLLLISKHLILCIYLEGVYCSRCVYYGKHQSFQATAGFLDYAPNAYSSSNGWSVFYQSPNQRNDSQG